MSKRGRIAAHGSSSKSSGIRATEVIYQSIGRYWQATRQIHLAEGVKYITICFAVRDYHRHNHGVEAQEECGITYTGESPLSESSNLSI